MEEMLITLGRNAQTAAKQLAQLTTPAKNHALQMMAAQLRSDTPKILAANHQDVANAQIKATMVDRLVLNQERIEQMAAGLEQIATLPDPIGVQKSGWTTQTNLAISQVTVPLGVIGMIYEARPNVTVDASGLCLKAGNAVILRGGSEALLTNKALVTSLRQALKKCNINENAVQLIEVTSHEVAQAFMRLNDYVDVLIPRGSARLINTVVQKASVPVIETGAGNCHIYVDESADLKMACDIIVNARCQRPSVCNSAEKVIVHEKIAARLLPKLAEALAAWHVELRGDEAVCQILPDAKPATAADWDEEYNDYILAIKVVADEQAAIDHINAHNTKHSEAIITENYAASQRFLAQVDAACVYVNASTRFTDGFEFGFGAEIGISTQKLHARGPLGLTALTSTKYQIRGNGQIRK